MKYTGFMVVAVLALMGTASGQQVRSVSGFTSVGNAGSFAVHIKIGGTESVKIEGADAGTLAKIETIVTNGRLEIRWKRGSEPRYTNGRIDVYVTAKSLSGLGNAGSGSVEVDGTLKGGNVEVELSGSGSMSAAVDAGKLDVSVSGSGSTKLRGKAGSTRIEVSGSGKLDAAGVSTDVAEVEISGSGNTFITVNKTISGSIAGSGGVRYSGAATVGSVTTSGSGRIKKVG